MPRITVSEETYKILAEQSKSFNLSISDIVTIGAFLVSKLINIPIETNKIAIINPKVAINKKRLDYEEAVNLLKRGYDLFIPDISIRKAIYIKRRLKNTYNFNTKPLPAEVTGKPGYLFLNCDVNCLELLNFNKHTASR